MKQIRKALTFRASSIGDCLMGKYLLDNVHAQFPDARLGIVVASRGGMIRDLLRSSPWIEVIEANRTNFRALWRLWKGWQGSDLVVTQYKGKGAGSFSLLTKCAARLLTRRGGLVGFADDSPFNAFLFDKIIVDPLAHAPAEDERQALRAYGLSVPVPYPVIELVPDMSLLEKFGVRPGQYVLVHLFSGSTKRGLHPKKRRALVDALRQVLPAEVEILVSGSGAERAEARAAAGEDARVIAGEVNLYEMMHLVAQSAGVAALDTGVAHIAAQLHKPVSVISTCMGLWWWNEEQYGPRASFKVFTAPLHSIPEHALEEYPACMNDVDLQAVARSLSPL